jgi:siroheme synthase (precorrin-2 oxidase/ferrochelatase)
VVAPSAVAALRDDPRLRWHQREYRRGEVASYRLAITATGVAAVDAQVAHDARAAGVPVNSADDPANCTFTLPAVARLGDIQVAVATTGRSPALASWLRSRIEAVLDDSLLDLLDLLATTAHGLSRCRTRLPAGAASMATSPSSCRGHAQGARSAAQLDRDCQNNDDHASFAWLEGAPDELSSVPDAWPVRKTRQ